MRTKFLVAIVAVFGATTAAASEAMIVSPGPSISPCIARIKTDHDHAGTSGHRSKVCGVQRLSEIEVSKAAGLGQIEIHGNIAAVLQRDEGVVTLLDVKDPRKPKILGRYDDDIADSFDGDLAFSKDGNWLFYARQTHQFSKDGVHVLDVSDPKAPRLAFYQPQGGSFRVGYLKQGDAEYVITMDAIAGLVVNRFDAATGALVPVYADPLPPLKVGGPASAGIYVDPKDPKLKIPLVYATNGTSGLDIYDMSDPVSPVKVGGWNEAGLADVEVVATNGQRRVFAASEYWFEPNTPAAVYDLNATRLDRIKVRQVGTGPIEPSEPWRIGGIETTGNRLHVTLGHVGLVSGSFKGRRIAAYHVARPVNEDATLKATPYAMDVDSSGGLLYLTDASSGRLTILKPR